MLPGRQRRCPIPTTRVDVRRSARRGPGRPPDRPRRRPLLRRPRRRHDPPHPLPRREPAAGRAIARANPRPRPLAADGATSTASASSDPDAADLYLLLGSRRRRRFGDSTRCLAEPSPNGSTARTTSGSASPTARARRTRRRSSSTSATTRRPCRRSRRRRRTPRGASATSINFTGSATDTRGRDRPAARLCWSLVTCTTARPTATRTRSGLRRRSRAARSRLPTTSTRRYIELTLTATDSAGLSATRRASISNPQTVFLNFASSPPGLQHRRRTPPTRSRRSPGR